MGDVVVILDRATGRDMDVLNYIAYIVILVQLACVGLVYATLKTLRQNSLRFSQTTYRLYLQVDNFLGVQFNLVFSLPYFSDVNWPLRSYLLGFRFASRLLAKLNSARSI
jgi:hypothetical protein